MVATTSKSSRRGADSETDEKPNFKHLLNMVKQSGATHSKIVHKRVKFLISTDDAYKFKTQSVRKAIKYGIPILHQAFLSTILNTGIIQQILKTTYCVVTATICQLTSQKYQSKNLYRQKYCHLMTLKLKKAELENIDTEEEAENVDKDSKKAKKKKKKKKKKNKHKKKNDVQ